MRINTMDAIKEIKDNNLVYYFIAFVIAIFIGYLLIFVFKIGVVFLKMVVQYWYFFLIGLLVILLLKKIRGRKKKEVIRE